MGMNTVKVKFVLTDGEEEAAREMCAALNTTVHAIQAHLPLLVLLIIGLLEDLELVSPLFGRLQVLRRLDRQRHCLVNRRAGCLEQSVYDRPKRCLGDQLCSSLNAQSHRCSDGLDDSSSQFASPLAPVDTSLLEQKEFCMASGMMTSRARMVTTQFTRILGVVIEFATVGLKLSYGVIRQPRCECGCLCREAVFISQVDEAKGVIQRSIEVAATGNGWQAVDPVGRRSATPV